MRSERGGHAVRTFSWPLPACIPEHPAQSCHCMRCLHESDQPSLLAVTCVIAVQWGASEGTEQDPVATTGSRQPIQREKEAVTPSPSAPSSLPCSWCYSWNELWAGWCPGGFFAIPSQVSLAGAVPGTSPAAASTGVCDQSERGHRKGSQEVCFKYFYFLIYIKVYIWLIYLFLYSEIHNQLRLKNKIVICFWKKSENYFIFVPCITRKYTIYSRTSRSKSDRKCWFTKQ